MFNNASHGLYSLGSVPDNGFIESVCAYGSYSDGDKGVVYVVVINNSTKKIRSFQRVVSGLPCLDNFYNRNRPRKGDLVTVYIPKNKHDNENKKTNQPLQIAFHNHSNKYKYKFLEGSAISETNVNSIQQGINRGLGKLNWKDLEDPTLTLNIQVRIISTCKILLARDVFYRYL